MRRLAARPRPAFRLLAAAALLAPGPATLGTAQAQVARDYINIVGSSTVYPFATVVAERFGRATRFKTPKVESTGTGGGIKLFCAGLGIEHPDIANASRRITESEIESCNRNGVDGVVEFEIGYDGIVLAASREAEPMPLTLRDVYLALAKNVPDPAGGRRFVPNPYRTWADVDPALPAIEIEVLGPPPTSGTRDAFVELAMEGGCDAFDWIAALDGDAHRAVCGTIREDGAYIEAGENDNLIVQKLDSNPAAVGVFGYSFLERNVDRVRPLSIDGVRPSFETISDGTYPIARPLYFYVKKAHVGVIPGIEGYLREFMGETAAGDFGYLSELGLVPLRDVERRQMLSRVESLEILTVADVR
ncbi:MAG TPA: PstS family phosphate ABC transporter substrate-binding protein [Gammaproteobacteria bacterium]